MSDNKKYYYLKVKENFFESEELIVLQGLRDGYLYSDILMKLYLRSLKYEGKLMFRDKIPYNPSVLAQVVRHNEGVVEKALSIFEKLDLIEILDNGAIFMSDIQSLIGRGSSEAERKARYRRKIEEDKNLLKSGTMSQGMSHSSQGHFPPEREIYIELETELKKEREKKDKTPISSSDDEPLSLDLVENFFEKAWALYPKKAGKSKISKKQKIKLYKLGDELIRAINRYKHDKELKINGGWREVIYGSSFFNTRYTEWTDSEFKKQETQIQETAAESRKKRIFEIVEQGNGGMSLE